MKLEKKEDHSVDTLILLRRGNEIAIEGEETEGMTIQRLPHLGIYPINNHHSQALIVDANKSLLTGT